jgi:hypothetical protein
METMMKKLINHNLSHLFCFNRDFAVWEFKGEGKNCRNALPGKQKNIVTSDGIHGHQFERLESFVPCYSQSFYWRMFEENQTILWVQKYIQKIPDTRKLQSIPEQHFVEKKKSG